MMKEFSSEAKTAINSKHFLDFLEQLEKFKIQAEHPELNSRKIRFNFPKKFFILEFSIKIFLLLFCWPFF